MSSLQNIVKNAAGTIVALFKDGTTSELAQSARTVAVSGAGFTFAPLDGIETLLIATAGSNRTVVLPNILGSRRRIRLVKTDSAAGSILLSAPDSAPIVGSNVVKVSGQGGTIELMGDGLTSWQLINLVDSGTFTATLGAISAGGTTTWSYSRAMNAVTMNMFGNSSGANNNFYWQFTKNGSAGAITMTGHPDSCKPTVASTWIQTWQVSYNNAGSPGTGLAVCGTELDTGQFNIFRSVAGDSFGASTQSALLANSFSYVIR